MLYLSVVLFQSKWKPEGHWLTQVCVEKGCEDSGGLEVMALVVCFESAAVCLRDEVPCLCVAGW